MAKKIKMLEAMAKAAVKLTDMANRAKKVVEEKKRRAQFAIIASTTEKWTWITDEKEGFVPAKILKENPDGSMEVEYGTTRSVKTISKKEVGPPIVRLAEVKNHVEGASAARATAYSAPPLRIALSAAASATAVRTTLQMLFALRSS